MAKDNLYRYSAPGILTDEQEESFQALEHEKMFGSDNADSELLSYTTVPSEDVVTQLMITNRLLGIMVTFVILYIALLAVRWLGRLITNTFKFI